MELTPDDKKQIIDSLKTRLTILKSGDLNKVRELLIELVPESVEDIKKAPENELGIAVNMMAAIIEPLVKVDLLKSEFVTWKLEGDIAEVTYKKKEEGTSDEVKMRFRKVGDKWV